ncbi:MAG: GspH/FimT family pseudopilin [Thermodesulfobacteriota bacterium]
MKKTTDRTYICREEGPSGGRSRDAGFSGLFLPLLMRKSRQGRKGSGQRGFSLVEILVVVAIFGTLLAVAAPSFITKTFPHMKLKSASRDIFSMLQYARSKAVNATQKYGVTFDLDASPKRYLVVTRASDADPWTADTSIAAKDLEDGVAIFNVTVGAVTYTSGTTAVIAFDPFGSATASNIRLNAASDTSDRQMVTVSSASGRVKILTTW